MMVRFYISLWPAQACFFHGTQSVHNGRLTQSRSGAHDRIRGILCWCWTIRREKHLIGSDETWRASSTWDRWLFFCFFLPLLSFLGGLLRMSFLRNWWRHSTTRIDYVVFVMRPSFFTNLFATRTEILPLSEYCTVSKWFRWRWMSMSMSGWFHSGQDTPCRCSNISGKSMMLFANIQLILDP